MNTRNLLGPWIRRFLLEHLVADRNLARHTQASYRDTLALLLPFVNTASQTPIDRLSIDQVSPTIVRRFLAYVENKRRCTVATRNQRLGAIHALARFIGLHNPEHLAWCADIRAIPFKKAPKPAMTYLDKPEVEALLKAADHRATQGPRDSALLLFLYNTGARADEAARLSIADLTLGRSPSVRLVGKGNKERHCPLWASTADALRHLVAGRRPDASVFLNRREEPLTRFGIYALVKRYVALASHHVPSLRTKRVSPHTLRHTTAVHLLRAGVDINTIRAWLGHVSLDTTHVYAEIDLEMKAKALAHCEVPQEDTAKQWQKEPDLLAFLKAL
jgi:integrase/recombinase XerD